MMVTQEVALSLAQLGLPRRGLQLLQSEEKTPRKRLTENCSTKLPTTSRIFPDKMAFIYVRQRRQLILGENKTKLKAPVKT